MKQIIAYALTILGITQLVGLLVGIIVSLPIAMAMPDRLKPKLVPLADFFTGAASLAAAITLFWLLGAPVTVFVPIVITSWLSFYFLGYQQRKSEWLSSFAGVLTAWVIYRLQFAPA